VRSSAAARSPTAGGSRSPSGRRSSPTSWRAARNRPTSPSPTWRAWSARTRTRLTLEADGAIRYAYTTGAAHSTLFGTRLAWANSIFGPSYNYETPRITLQDGEEIPADLQAELKALTDELTEDVDWQDGDVALIDNTRVMHGRREILDTDRTIYNAQSYIRRELVDGVTAGGGGR
jgi:hypothetical protein